MVTLGRAREKYRKGYHYLGIVWLNTHGSRTNPPQPPKPPVDIAALFGGGDGFYF